MQSRPSLEVKVGNANLPLQHLPERATGQFQAEMWCEFDCVAYVFTGDDQVEITDRLQAARSGEQTWDYVRPLSREELYAGLV